MRGRIGGQLADFPITVAFNPAGTRAYVANPFTDNLTVVEVDGLKRDRVTKQVPASQLTIPFGTPPVRNTEADTDRVVTALDKGLISNQTATRELGYDPALEAELMSNERSPDAPEPDPDA